MDDKGQSGYYQEIARAFIARRGGPAIQDESNAWVRAHGPVSHSHPAWTSGGKLPAKYVIHAVGPVWGEGGEEAKLRRAVGSALARAEELGLAYEHDAIAFDDPRLKSPEFLALNPNGKVPTIVIDGQPMFESIAIQIYLGERFGVTGYPETFVIDRNGHVVEHFIGPEDWATEEAFRFFSGLLDETAMPGGQQAR